MWNLSLYYHAHVYKYKVAQCIISEIFSKQIETTQFVIIFIVMIYFNKTFLIYGTLTIFFKWEKQMGWTGAIWNF